MGKCEGKNQFVCDRKCVPVRLPAHPPRNIWHRPRCEQTLKLENVLERSWENVNCVRSWPRADFSRYFYTPPHNSTSPPFLPLPSPLLLATSVSAATDRGTPRKLSLSKQFQFFVYQKFVHKVTISKVHDESVINAWGFWWSPLALEWFPFMITPQRASLQRRRLERYKNFYERLLIQ